MPTKRAFGSFLICLPVAVIIAACSGNKPQDKAQSTPSLSPAIPSHGTTIGVYKKEGAFLLRNSLSAGSEDITVKFGKPGDIPVAGDWDGNGTTTIGVYRPDNNTFYLRNKNTDGEPDLTVKFGVKFDLPVVGDWDGNGTVTIGVFRPSSATFLLRNLNKTGEADLTFTFGRLGDLPVAGDWDGDGKMSIGVFRREVSSFFLRNDNSTGNPDYSAVLRVEARCSDCWRLGWRQNHDDRSVSAVNFLLLASQSQYQRCASNDAPLRITTRHTARRALAEIHRSHVSTNQRSTTDLLHRDKPDRLAADPRCSPAQNSMPLCRAYHQH